MSIEEIAMREVALTTCHFYSRQVERAELQLTEAVNSARRSGCSWIEIGIQLGTSHQAAINRFAKRVDRVDLRRRTSPRRAEVRALHGWKNPEGDDAA